MSFRVGTLFSQDNLALHYREYGSAASSRVPLLCLAGLTRHSGDYHAIALRHESRRRVLCPDYRGRGRSAHDRDWRGYSPQNYLNDILHLLAARNIHRVVVLGTSMGGLLAMALGAARPSLLAGVILNDIGPDIAPGGYARIRTRMGNNAPTRGWDEAVALLRKAFPTLSYRTDAEWLNFARNTFREDEDGLLRADYDPAIVTALARAPAPPDLWPLYRTLKHLPVLAVRGGVSDLLSEATFARMAQEKPDLIQVVVPGVGHVPSLQEPEVAEVVDEFLDRF